MKNQIFLLKSPCYKANGYDGAYYSIAVIDENGDIIKGHGDHIGFVKNVFESNGQAFSDDDRYISIEEVTEKVTEQELDVFIGSYKSSRKDHDIWLEKRDEFVGGSLYDFLYTPKGVEKTENRIKFNKWLSENPQPKMVDYYGFLNLIER